MHATAQELSWARAIKQAVAVETDPAINAAHLTDFEYLQHAIVAKDQVHKALKRIKNMQKFKQRYGIQLDGSVEEAARDLQRFRDAYPTYKSTIASTADHIHLSCLDAATFDATRLKSEEAYAIVSRYAFYVMQACHPNIAAMRAGYVFLCDCHCMKWNNFSYVWQERAAQLYSQGYPGRVVQMVMLQVPLLMRFLFNLVKPLLSKKFRQSIVNTAEREEWLEASPWPPYAVPKEWGGTLEWEGNDPASVSSSSMLQKLQERYENAAKFKL